ncbi:MAG: LPS assembly protein LptD [Brachymonas sp.]|nr:LPS assembly protein LptD [Brachymonas sp.]
MEQARAIGLPGPQHKHTPCTTVALPTPAGFDGGPNKMRIRSPHNVFSMAARPASATGRAVRRSSAHPPLPLRPLQAGLLLACLMMAPWPAAYAQEASGRPTPTPERALTLIPSPWLQEELPTAAPQAPAFISGQQVEGEIDRHITAKGEAEIRKPGSVLKGDVIRYDQSSNTLLAQGRVRLNQMGNVFRGDALQLQLDSYAGSLDNVRFSLLQTGGGGTASKVEFIDQEHGIIHNARYSTCFACVQKLENDRAAQPATTAANDGAASAAAAAPSSAKAVADATGNTQGTVSSPPPSWSPSWYVRGERIYLDMQEDVGHVENGALVLGGVPVLPVSNFSFPLSDKRRSGLLPPTVQFNSNSGMVYSQPYYFNIAPNRDATVATNISTRRGIDLYGQFRYLEPTYRGALDVNVMPNDRLTGSKRWRYAYTHNQQWATSALGAFNLALDLASVSDNTYWRDFQDIGRSQNKGLISERLIPSTGTLGWHLGHWSAYLREQRWQTLQLPAPDDITPPFDLSPQLHLRYARDNVAGFDVALDLDRTRFRSDPQLTGYPSGTRSYAHARISHPWLRPWGFLRPTLEWHTTRYETDTPMPNGARSASRALPTATLDGGLVLERDARLFGRSVSQTLEPRLFYTYTPLRQQNHLPAYDSALKDFNLASIFSSKPFTGADRISNNNTLTAGLTTRLYDTQSGAELARLSLAQRHRFTPRQVFLNAADQPAKRSFSDILGEASINWHRSWSARATVAYDQRTSTISSGRIGARYSPGPYRVISANLSRQTDGYEQIDAGWQWPINDLWGDKGQDLGPGRGQGQGRWYSVGRVYYSISDRRITDSLLGLEYDSCCWIGRIAWRRRQTQTLPVAFNNSIMVQLELTGLARIGTGAQRAFRDNVPGYTPLREPRQHQPSRFSRYD